MQPTRKFAAAAVYAALKQQSDQTAPVWNQTLQKVSGLKESDVMDIARNIVHHVSEEIETASRRWLVAAKKKYGNDRFQKVSRLLLPVF